MPAAQTYSHRLDSFAEQRLSWLLPIVSAVACVAILWQSSSAMLIAKPSPAARRSSFTARAGEQISTMKPISDFEHAAEPGLDATK